MLHSRILENLHPWCVCCPPVAILDPNSLYSLCPAAWSLPLLWAFSSLLSSVLSEGLQPVNDASTALALY